MKKEELELHVEELTNHLDRIAYMSLGAKTVAECYLDILIDLFGTDSPKGRILDVDALKINPEKKENIMQIGTSNLEDYFADITLMKIRSRKQ